MQKCKFLLKYIGPVIIPLPLLPLLITASFRKRNSHMRRITQYFIRRLYVAITYSFIFTYCRFRFVAAFQNVNCFLFSFIHAKPHAENFMSLSLSFPVYTAPHPNIRIGRTAIYCAYRYMNITMSKQHGTLFFHNHVCISLSTVAENIL